MYLREFKSTRKPERDNSVQQEEQGDLGTSDTVKIYITAGQIPGTEVPAESRLIEAVEKPVVSDEADL